MGFPSLDGLTVWDIGCGWGDFATALLGAGASHVIASDTAFDLSDAVSRHDRISLLQERTQDLFGNEPSGGVALSVTQQELHTFTFFSGPSHSALKSRCYPLNSPRPQSHGGRS